MATGSIRKLMIVIAGAVVCWRLVASFATRREPKYKITSQDQCGTKMSTVALAVLGYCNATGRFRPGRYPIPICGQAIDWDYMCRCALISTTRSFITASIKQKHGTAISTAVWLVSGWRS